MYKDVRLLFVFLVFHSCIDKEKSLPKDLIEQEKMVSVISEMELTQTFIRLKFVPIDSINHSALYNCVFEKHGITEQQFNKSLKYYSENPKEMENIYARVLTELSEREAEYQTTVKRKKENDD